jgi:type VI secretion system protein ImpL
LKKARGKKGINGVIVPVGVEQIADRPDAELDKLGRRVRDRISQLNQHLEIQFPTYLVLTGCDRFAGFADFFADLEGDKRFQPWGATVAVSDAGKYPAEELFDAEFRQLGAALARRTLNRIPQLADDEPRARVFALPQQLERVRPFVRRVVHSLFDSTGKGQRPLFRGFYLTSAAPGGGAVDRVYATTAGGLGFAAAEQQFPPATGGPWFVNELFTKVIFADKDLVTETDEVIRRKQLARKRLTIGLATLLAAFTISCSWISCANHAPVGKARDAARELRKISATADFRRYVEVLDGLRSSITRLERLEGHVEWWRHLGG